MNNDMLQPIFFAWQIALQLVRQGAADEPAVGDQTQSLSDEPAVVEVEVAESDEPVNSKVTNNFFFLNTKEKGV